MFGPFQDRARACTTIMRSSTGFQPTEGAAHAAVRALRDVPHARHKSARAPNGEVIGELPEQVPYHEWKHSAFAGEQRSCQSCHMPVVEEDTPLPPCSARRGRASRATRSSAAISSCSGC